MQNYLGRRCVDLEDHTLANDVITSLLRNCRIEDECKLGRELKSIRARKLHLADLNNLEPNVIFIDYVRKVFMNNPKSFST